MMIDVRRGLGWLGTAGFLVGLAALPAGARDLSFEDRIDAQRAIEEVYWKHRLWPAENASPKPALAEVMPDAAIRAKVETYLKESAALETIWRCPITHDQLQAEIGRMVRDTRDERMLTDLFHALGDDASVIAETLARQTLADRLIRDWYAHDTRFHGALRRRAETARAAVGRPEDLTAAGGEYRKATYRRDEFAELLRHDARERIVGRISPVEETWDAFTITAVLSDRDDAVEVATVTWPKVAFDAWWTGQRASLAVELDAPSGSYTIASPLSADCVPDSWTPTYFGVPDGRRLHTAVWTGSEMIVWGGVTVGGSTPTGGRYSPATNTWTPTSTGPGVPRARSSHTAVWTGASMVVWGGNAAPPGPNSAISSGARYDPSTDSWLPVSTSGAPSARFLHSATWTGSLMVVWGGSPATNTGGRYNPSSDTWSATSTGAGVPAARQEHAAVLAFPDVIVWGGRDAGGNALNTGAKYSPASDTWTPATTTGAASARWGHAAIWTGSEMIVWGGRSNVGPLNTGGRWQASTNSWTATSLGSGLPTPRYDHSYVWTAGKLIVWGGLGAGVTNTGASYDPPTDTWTQTSLGANVPAARQGATAVWTNNEMIVWGGLAATALNTGGRYNPVSNTWVATSTGSYAPPPAASTPRCGPGPR
jgi:N-acetylneuraminic acid mutarotase